MVFCVTKQGSEMTGFCLKQSQGLKVFCVERVRFFPSQLVKCCTILQSYHCSITVRLSKDSCGVGSKAYLEKLNRRAACNIEGRSIEAEELKSTLGWPSLHARRNDLKCVLVHKCLHGIAPSYLLSEFRQAHLFHVHNTRTRDLLRPPFARKNY